MVTGTYLITHEWIEDGRLALVIFSIGSAAGAFIALYLYAKFAKYLQKKFELTNRVVDISISILFFSFAAYHVFKQIYLVYFKHR
jgi:uncharacterized membrane protein required for colicin V production